MLVSLGKQQKQKNASQQHTRSRKREQEAGGGGAGWLWALKAYHGDYFLKQEHTSRSVYNLLNVINRGPIIPTYEPISHPISNTYIYYSFPYTYIQSYAKLRFKSWG